MYVDARSQEVQVQNQKRPFLCIFNFNFLSLKLVHLAAKISDIFEKARPFKRLVGMAAVYKRFSTSVVRSG